MGWVSLAGGGRGLGKDGMDLGPFDVLKVRKLVGGRVNGEGEVGYSFLFEGQQYVGNGLGVLGLPGVGDFHNEIGSSRSVCGLWIIYLLLGVVEEDDRDTTEESMREPWVDGGMKRKGVSDLNQGELLEVEIDAGGVDDGKVNRDKLTLREVGAIFFQHAHLFPISGW